MYSQYEKKTRGFRIQDKATIPTATRVNSLKENNEDRLTFGLAATLELSASTRLACVWPKVQMQDRDTKSKYSFPGNMKYYVLQGFSGIYQ